MFAVLYECFMSERGVVISLVQCGSKRVFF